MPGRSSFKGNIGTLGLKDKATDSPAEKSNVKAATNAANIAKKRFL